MTTDIDDLSPAPASHDEAAALRKAVWSTPMLTSLSVSMSEIGAVGSLDGADTFS